MVTPLPIPHPGRKKAAICQLSKFLFVHGGIDERDIITNSLQLFDIKNREWIKTLTNNKTFPLELHAMAAAFHNPAYKIVQDLTVPVPKIKGKSNEGIYVFGGRDEIGKSSAILWRYRLFSNPWYLDKVHTMGIGPSGRYGHSLNYLPTIHSLIVYGGEDSPTFFGDLFMYSLNIGHWIDIKFTSKYKPQPRSRFTCTEVSDGKVDRIYILGGVASDNFLGGNIECVEFDENLYSKIVFQTKENSLSRKSSQDKDKVLIDCNELYDKKKRYVNDRIKVFKRSNYYLPIPTEAGANKMD